MAWGYWSATSVSDRGRSPRREKDKQQQHQSLHQHQQQQSQQVYQTQSDLSQSTYGVQQGELAAIPGCAVAVVEEPPCSMMIQGGSFYSYSAATAAAAAVASRRITTGVEGGPSSSVTSTGIQVLPRERHIRPGTSAYAPQSPGSGDSAEYEQPIVTSGIRGEISPPRGGTPHDDIFAPSTSSIRPKPPLPCDPEGMEDLPDVELEEVHHNAELIYASRGLGTTTCRVHGLCNPPPEPAPSMTSLLDEHAGSSQFQFNEITWGR